MYYVSRKIAGQTMFNAIRAVRVLEGAELLFTLPLEAYIWYQEMKEEDRKYEAWEDGLRAADRAYDSFEIEKWNADFQQEAIDVIDDEAKLRNLPSLIDTLERIQKDRK